MQADGRIQDSERCFAAALRCCEDPLLVCALQTAGENDNSEIGYLNEEQGHAIAHGVVLQIAFDSSNPRAQSGMV